MPAARISNQLHKFLQTILDHPAMCFRELRLTVIGLKVRSDILALQNLKVEESIELRVHTFSMSPLDVTGLQHELDLMVPRMMGKLCSRCIAHVTPP